jgi:hypothetical protein
MEEGHAHLPLEQPDLFADGGLGDADRLRRPRDAAGADDGLEVGELVEFHLRVCFMLSEH